MNIAYLSNSSLPTTVANSIHVMRMCDSMSSAGHDVTLYAVQARKEPHDYIRRYYAIKNRFSLCLGKKRKTPLFGALFYGYMQARRAIRAGHDVFYARCIYSALFVRLRNLPLAIELHETPRNVVQRYVLRSILRGRNTSLVVVISARLKARIQEQYPWLASEKLLVAHDGATLVPTVEHSNTSAEEQKVLRIGYTGGVRDGNGIKTIIEIARRLPQHEFEIVGGNTTSVQRYWSIGIPRNLRFLPAVDPSEVTSVQTSYDVLLAPYVLGPKTTGGRDTSDYMSPLKIFEYMAAKRPIIVSDFPVIREVLNDACAELVAPEAVDDWVAAVKRLESPQYRQKLASAAFDLLKKTYTWDVRVKVILDRIVSLHSTYRR